MNRRKGGQKEGQTDTILQDPSGRGWECNNLSSASDWWEYIKSCFKENAKVFSKYSTTQENIGIELILLSDNPLDFQ